MCVVLCVLLCFAVICFVLCFVLFAVLVLFCGAFRLFVTVCFLFFVFKCGVVLRVVAC